MVKEVKTLIFLVKLIYNYNWTKTDDFDQNCLMVSIIICPLKLV